MRRWAVLLGCFIGLGVSVPAMLMFPFGLYMEAMTAEFGWSRTAFAATLSAVAVCNMIALPLAGYAVDRFGPVRCILVGLIGGCLACAGLALVKTYPAFVAVSCLATASGCLAVYPAYFSIVRGWFDKNLGFALAVASAGVSVGVAGFAFLIKANIDANGWRSAFVTAAAVALTVGLAALFLLVRENRGALPAPEQSNAKAEAPLTGQSLGQAMRTTHFWLFSIAFALVVFAGAGPNAHLPSLVGDSSAAFLAAMAMGSLFGRIVTGPLLDRAPVWLVAIPFFAAQALGIFMLWYQVAWVVPAAFLMGTAVGAELDMMGFVMARRFGRLAYARIFGSSFAISHIGLVASPIVMGAIFDASQAYDLALLTYPILPLIAALLVVIASTQKFLAASVAPSAP